MTEENVVESKPVVKADAKNRSLRTLGQTIIGGVPAGAVLIVGEVLTDTFTTGEVVTVAGLVMALVPPLAAYFWRRLEK